MQEIRWLLVYNTESEAIPPFGVMEPDPTGDVTADGAIAVRQPTALGRTAVFFNGPHPIPPLSLGQAHQTFPTIAAFLAGAPVAGEIWGTAPDTWLLQKGTTGSGFLILGGVEAVSSQGSNQLVNVMQEPPVAAAATGASKDVNYYRQVGTSPLDLYYAGGNITGSFTASVNALDGLIEAIPFPATRACTLDKLALWFDAAGSAGALVRLGIYKAASDLNLYPSALIYDSGNLAADATSSDYLEDAIGLTLDANTLYWLCTKFNFVGTMPVCGGTTDVFMYNILGLSSTSFDTYFAFRGTHAFASAFPDPFPASIPPANGTFILPVVHLSA